MSAFEELVKSIKLEEKEKYTKALEEIKEDFYKTLLNEGYSTTEAHKLVMALNKDTTN